MGWIIVVVLLCILFPAFARLVGATIRMIVVLMVVLFAGMFFMFAFSDCSDESYDYEPTEYHDYEQEMDLETKDELNKWLEGRHKTPEPDSKPITEPELVKEPIVIEPEVEYTEEEE